MTSFGNYYWNYIYRDPIPNKITFEILGEPILGKLATIQLTTGHVSLLFFGNVWVQFKYLAGFRGEARGFFEKIFKLYF